MMKKLFGLIMLSGILAITLISCGDDDTDPIEKKITSFVFLLTENPINVNVIAQVDESAKTITAIMPEGTDVNGLIPSIEVSSGATISPTTAQNFNNPITYTVTGSDGSTATYTATVTAALSQRDILQIILDENPGNGLGWDLPNTANLNSLSGVATDINGNIIELDMVLKDLIHLPAEIGQLTALRELRVSGNDFNALPPEIGQLTNLRILEATALFMTSLPSEIGQLTSLENLELAANSLTTLPQSIGNLSNLMTLSVFENRLTSIPSEIGQLSQVFQLELDDNELSSIPAEIGQLANLRTLDLGDNQLTSIPSEIGNLSNLTRLSIEQNQITSLPKEIGNLTNLQILFLDNNELSSIPPEIGFLLALEALTTRENNFTALPRAVCNLAFFNDLLIDGGSGFDCTNSPTPMDALISIYSANTNNTLGWGVDDYPEVAFTSGGSPKTITANNKNLVLIPLGVSGLTSLEVLNINNNSFGGPIALTPDIGDISTLVSLTLGTTGINTFPASFGNLENLTSLSLTDNPITSIPQEVCDLQISNGGILTIFTDPGEECD